MLVNLKPNKRAGTVLQKRKKSIKRAYPDEKGIPVRFDNVFLPYKPNGLEYVPDDSDNFTGVYIFWLQNASTWINALSTTTALESLVDFGNVDNASQAIREFVKLGIKGNHVILMHPIRRKRVYTNEESWGTYRWHKNGGYAGKANVCCEYFREEPDERLKQVYLYEVYRVV